MKYAIVILFTFLLSVLSSSAQTTSTNSTESKLPVWVQMMEDENANYYEAVAAFNDYLKTHPQPEEEVEEELMGGDRAAIEEHEKEMRRESKKIKTDEQRKALVEKEVMAYQVKRFRNWMNEVKPFVQENGHILTANERIALWEKQKEEMKNSTNDKK